MERQRLEHELELKKLEYSRENQVVNHDKSSGFNFYTAVKCVPKFDADDVESSFIAFKNMAHQLKWPTEHWSILIQGSITGKARSVSSALNAEQLTDYRTVKAVILSAYELLPDAYRKKFRNLKRNQGQTYVEFARSQELMFDKWYRSLRVEQGYAQLREVVLMEQFKTCLPSDIVQVLNNQGISELAPAAIKADEYELNAPKPEKPHNSRWKSGSCGNSRKFFPKRFGQNKQPG